MRVYGGRMNFVSELLQVVKKFLQNSVINFISTEVHSYGPGVGY